MKSIEYLLREKEGNKVLDVHFEIFEGLKVNDSSGRHQGLQLLASSNGHCNLPQLMSHRKEVSKILLFLGHVIEFQSPW